MISAAEFVAGVEGFLRLRLCLMGSLQRNSEGVFSGFEPERNTIFYLTIPESKFFINCSLLMPMRASLAIE